VTPETLSAFVQVRLRSELSAEDRKQVLQDMAKPFDRAIRMRKRPLLRVGVAFFPHEVRMVEAVRRAMQEAAGGERVTTAAALELLMHSGLRAVLTKSQRPGELRRILDA
jgi:hypothetical protein